MELARCEYIQRRENVIAVSNSGTSGTSKTHVALGLGLAACQRGCPWASLPLIRRDIRVGLAFRMSPWFGMRAPAGVVLPGF